MPVSLLVAALAIAATPPGQAPTSDDLIAHEEMIVLDTHLDTPVNFERKQWDFGDFHRFVWDNSQVDLPRMEAGGLDGGFFVVYTRQGPLTPEGYKAARDTALLRAAAIQRVVAAHSDKMAFATTSDDARRLAGEGKRIVFQSIENSYPLGTEVSMLQSFYALGVRLAGPVYSKNNQFADSATDTPRWHGLSPLGRDWLVEMNRLGMIVDASHSSDETFDQLLTLSKTPIILSHSGPRAMFDHPRNLDDGRMRKLAAAGGVMQVNSVFLVPYDSSPERSAIEDRQEQFATLSPQERRRLIADKAALDAKQPRTTATFDMFMASLLHAIQVMGVDHVGIGCDWDGGGGVIGMEDVSHLPQITARLRQASYSNSDIAKIWGGNVLRLLDQAQAYASKLQQSEGLPQKAKAR